MNIALLSTTALVAIVVCAPAVAQEPNRPTDPTATLVEDVVVTARRREEQLADVPASVSSLTERDIDNLPVERIEDYLRQTPSATVVFGGPDYLKDVSIRGVGGGRNGFSESATGLYRNGVYVAGGGFGGRSFNALDLFDARAFEVYRGPQGALYGRNAVGGAVNVVSQQPTFDPEGEVEVAYDDRARVGLNGAINLPLVADRLALRLGAVYFDQSEGFITNTAGDFVDQQSFLGLRAAALLALDEASDVTVTYERSDADAPPFSSLGQRLPVASRPTARIDPDPRVRTNSRFGEVRIEEDAAFLNYERRFSFADFALVGSWKQRDAGRFDEDLDHFLGFEDISGSDLTVSQSEVYERYGVQGTLISNGDGPVDWLVGFDFQTYEDDVTIVQGGVTNVAALREQSTRTDLSNEELDSVSAFANLDWHLADAWTLSVEGRVQRDEKAFSFQRVDRMPTPTNTSAGPLFSSYEDTQFTPGLTLKYAYDADSQVYARLASAYRPGGFNVGTTDINNIPYDAETALGGELGWKTRLGSDVRLGVSAYIVEVDDAQINTAASSTDTTVVLQNVTGVRLWGFEAELLGRWELGPGGLRVSVSASTQDGEYDDGATVLNNGVRYDVSGARVNRVRDFIGSVTGTYEWVAMPGWSAWVTGSVTGETGGYENAIGSLKVPGQSRSSQDYALFHLRGGLRSDDWTLAVSINNLFDEVYVTQEVLQNAYYNDGRVIGIQLTRRFGGQ